MEIYKQCTKFRALAACLLWVYASLAAAAVSPQLFESEVTVQSQAPALRAAAMKSALEEVLARVAGDASVLQTEPAQVLLQKPSRLVQQYRYFTVPGSQPPVLKLWVRFDGNAIQQSLQQQDLAYRGAERPDTLVWLAVDDSGTQYLVSADDQTDVHRQMAAQARQRGLPILFPLMDLEDQTKARFTDIWNGYIDSVIDGSARYKPQAILIGRLQRDGSAGWYAHWHLDAAGRPVSWSDSRLQLAALLQQGLDDTADQLASRFAMGGNGFGSNAVSISVDGVNSLAAYARVNEYLASLTQVAGFQVESINGSEVQYGLRLNGGLQDLTQTVSIGTVLEPVSARVPGYYQLRQ
ncbi:MAG: DUF2066 domain-containing protein [Gammaproteobacteria bacterium]|jgi:hypothetical protein